MPVQPRLWLTVQGSGMWGPIVFGIFLASTEKAEREGGQQYNHTNSSTMREMKHLLYRLEVYKIFITFLCCTGFIAATTSSIAFSCALLTPTLPPSSPLGSWEDTTTESELTSSLATNVSVYYAATYWSGIQPHRCSLIQWIYMHHNKNCTWCFDQLNSEGSLSYLHPHMLQKLPFPVKKLYWKPQNMVKLYINT